MSARLQYLRERLQTDGWAGAVLMPSINLTYLTGLRFHPGKRLTLLLLSAGDTPPVMVLPQLELERVRASVTFETRFFAWNDAEGPLKALATGMEAAFGAGVPARPIAIEHTVMRVMELHALEMVAPGI